MVNKNKRKGGRWEHDLVEILEDEIKGAKVKRVPGSGAIGTTLGEPNLTGDVVARFPGLNRDFKIEAKTGYGGATQITVQREWLNKIVMEAKGNFAYPLLACKFSDARKSGGVQYFVSMDIDTFIDIMNYIGDMTDGYLGTNKENISRKA